MALRRHVKNLVKNYSDAEVKVREATSNDPWGPSGSLMSEISDLTYNTISLSEIMNMIWHRMNGHGKNWRHVYKSLMLLEYLLKNGSKKVIQHCQEGFFNIQMLKDFQHLDEGGKDQGYHVREKSKQVLALLKDEQLLHSERETARRIRRRTSYVMLFPQNPSDKACFPSVPVSELVSVLPPSENLEYFHPKALSTAELSQPPPQTRSKVEIVQEITTFNVAAKNSSEDLIIFSEDESSIPPTKEPVKVYKEELVPDKIATTRNSWNTKTAVSFSERNQLPFPKRNSWVSGRKSKSSVVSRVVLKSPPRRESSIRTHKVAATWLDRWSPDAEEFATPTKQQVSKLNMACCRTGASVETIFKSPTFQPFHPLENSAATTMKSTPAFPKQFSESSTANSQSLRYFVPNTTQSYGISTHPTIRPDSSNSCGAMSSFATSSTPSPESAVPNNSPQSHCVPSHGCSYLPPTCGLTSSFLKDLEEKFANSFSPHSVSNVFENDLLNLLPDNSKRYAKNTDRFRTYCATVESHENSVVHSVPPEPKPGASELLCMSTEPKDTAVLEEIKSEVCGLRGDFSSVAQELRTIGNELVNMVASIQNISKSLEALQIIEDDPGPLITLT